MYCIWIGRTGTAFRIPIFELFLYLVSQSPCLDHPQQDFFRGQLCLKGAYTVSSTECTWLWRPEQGNLGAFPRGEWGKMAFRKPKLPPYKFLLMVACRVGTCGREDRGCVCVSPLLGQRHRVPRIFQSKKTHSWASNKKGGGRW